MFKKICLFIVLLILGMIVNNSKTKTEMVYSEIEEHNYRQIYLLFENNNLNTNNFTELFKNVEVLKIYPYINPVYASRIKANYNYSFNGSNYSHELEKFKTAYLKVLKNIGLVNEANYYQSSGVIIKKVLVYEDINNLRNLLGKFNGIKYSVSYNGIYYNL